MWTSTDDYFCAERRRDLPQPDVTFLSELEGLVLADLVD